MFETPCTKRNPRNRIIDVDEAEAIIDNGVEESTKVLPTHPGGTEGYTEGLDVTLQGLLDVDGTQGGQGSAEGMSGAYHLGVFHEPDGVDDDGPSAHVLS